MILEIMVFVLGMVAAGLLSLLAMPLVARRAARQTRIRLEATLPTSRDEIAADKDRLRAQYALRERRLEQAIGQLNQKLAARMVDNNRRIEDLRALTSDRDQIAASLAANERQAAELATSLERTEHRLSATRAELVMRDERIAARDADIQHLRSNIAIRDLLTEEQRLELVARETAVANLTDAVAHGEALVAATAAERDELAAGVAIERNNLADRDAQIRALEATMTTLAAERAERTAELDRRAEEIAALQDAMATTPRDERVAELETTLAMLRVENADLRDAFGAQWESERQDGARLRDRLGEIAAHIVRMSEGQGRVVTLPTTARANGIPLVEANGSAEAADGSKKMPPQSDTRALGERLRAAQQVAARA